MARRAGGGRVTDFNSPVEFMARREQWNYGISLYARQVTKEGEHLIAQPLVLAPHERFAPAEPFAMVDIEQAQQLMDELWQCGLRPSEGTGSAGSLRATERHLEDMRKLVARWSGAVL